MYFPAPFLTINFLSISLVKYRFAISLLIVKSFWQSAEFILSVLNIKRRISFSLSDNSCVNLASTFVNHLLTVSIVFGVVSAKAFFDLSKTAVNQFSLISNFRLKPYL